MNAINESTKLDKDHTPQMFFNMLNFNDGSSLPLTRNSIVVFTGANNSGKSRVLREISSVFHEYAPVRCILSGYSVETLGRIDEAYLSRKLKRQEDGRYMLETNSGSVQNWIQLWDNQDFRILFRLHVNRLDTEHRLMSSDEQPFENGSASMIHSPMNSLYKSNELEDIISSLFKDTFGESLIVNRRAGAAIALHVGEPPLWVGQREGEGEYYKAVEALPRLVMQGDGMRSFASILLDAFTSDYSITLIDEPEAFLHPPQARILGKMLATPSTRNRQLFIATHSTDFIHGLLDADNDNVIVIHINRIGNSNFMNALSTDRIRELWKKPLLRYSNILDGIFHEKVIICESEYDCLFYRAILDAICERDGKTAPDIMFTQCGGKDRIQYAVAALSALKVPVVAITDFDVMDNRTKLRELVTSFGLSWDSLSEDMNKIFDCINANDGQIRKVMKKIGSSVLSGDAPAAFCDLDSKLRSVGLFIVPVGEIECFDKTVNREKKDWVYSILERGNLGDDERLESARKFIMAIVDFKPQFNPVPKGKE